VFYWVDRTVYLLSKFRENPPVAFFSYVAHKQKTAVKTTLRQPVFWSSFCLFAELTRVRHKLSRFMFKFTKFKFSFRILMFSQQQQQSLISLLVCISRFIACCMCVCHMSIKVLTYLTTKTTTTTTTTKNVGLSTSPLRSIRFCVKYVCVESVSWSILLS